MNKLLVSVGIAVAIGVTSAPASAATWNLNSLTNASAQGTTSFILSGDTTFTSDAGGNMTGNGTFSALAQITPTTQLFTHDFTGMTISNTGDPGAPVGASAFDCVEGNFGAIVGASLCGNYSFGDDGIDDGGAGDDVVLGAPQSIDDYDPLFFAGWNDINKTLWMTNVDAEGFGYTLELQQVPVPAAAWLFGSALGLLGWMRRKSG